MRWFMSRWALVWSATPAWRSSTRACGVGGCGADGWPASVALVTAWIWIGDVPAMVSILGGAMSAGMLLVSLRGAVPVLTPTGHCHGSRRRLIAQHRRTPVQYWLVIGQIGRDGDVCEDGDGGTERGLFRS